MTRQLERALQTSPGASRPYAARAAATARLLLALTFPCLPAACRSETSLPVEDLPLVSIQEELRIGGFVPDLGPIRWHGVSVDGTIAVSQRDDHLLRLLNGLGEDVAAVGGPGEGPPEAEVKGGAGWIRDTLWVRDVMRGRILLYSNDWKPVRALPPLAGAGSKPGEEQRYPRFLSLWPLSLSPGDTLLVMASQPVAGGAARAYSGGVHLLRVSYKGLIEGHVLALSAGSDPDRAAPDPRIPWPFSLRLGVSPFHVAPDGSRIAVLRAEAGGPQGSPWSLLVVDASGGVVLDRAYRVAGSSGPVDVVVGSDQRIWLGFESSSGARAWVALTNAGEPLGRVLLPEGARVLEAARDHLWVAEPDAAGMPTVARYWLPEER